MTDFADLIKEAEARLAEQEAEEQEASAELGDSVDLDEKESWVGRYRGDGTAHAKRDGKATAVAVYLLWDADGAKRFMWPKTRLQQELDELRPNVGDRVAIVRGQDIPNSDPNRNPTQRFAVKVAPCDDPLPGETPSGDDIPF